MILVTGSTTLIGKKFTEKLLAEGQKVRCMDFEKPKNFTKNVEFIEGDVLDHVVLKKACQGIESVFHFMDIQNTDHHKRRFMKKINVKGTQNILSAARKAGVQRFFFLSSYEIYGRPKAIPVRQDDPKKPVTPYGKDKLKAETLCWNITKKGPMALTIFRPALITGPGTDDPVILITLFMAMGMAEANRMYITGNGDNKFQFLHLDDAVNAFISAYKNKNTGNKVYNLGSDNVLTQMEQIVHIKDKAKLDFTVRHLSPGYARFLSFVLRPFNIHYLTKEHLLMLLGNILMDCQVAKNDLGWQPSKTNTEIILDTIEWYKKEKL